MTLILEYHVLNQTQRYASVIQLPIVNSIPAHTYMNSSYSYDMVKSYGFFNRTIFWTPVTHMNLLRLSPLCNLYLFDFNISIKSRYILIDQILRQCTISTISTLISSFLKILCIDHHLSFINIPHISCINIHFKSTNLLQFDQKLI